jgi:cell shape-determining protein MreC
VRCSMLIPIGNHPLVLPIPSEEEAILLVAPCVFSCRSESRCFFFEIVIAFSGHSLLKCTLMAQRDSALFTVTPRSVSLVAILFLLLAVVFGLLNGQKAKALRTTAATPRAAVSTLPTPGSGVQQQGKASHAEDRAAKAEAALAQAEKDKADLRNKLDTTQQEIAALRERTPGSKESEPAGAGAQSENAKGSDLQSQLDDLRRQLDGAEKEKALLAEKLQDAQERAAQPKEAKSESKKKRDHESTTTQRESVSSHRAGVHGTVLAYNQAYNFVVLNLGARNGVEPNSEMLVLRDGTLIGKIRISSVEPTTAIGDIITNSLARGVEVQPGDSVIYAGTSP